MGIGALVMLAPGLSSRDCRDQSAKLGDHRVVGCRQHGICFYAVEPYSAHSSAIETSIINNTMLIQIAILAWIFLDEQLSSQEIGGLILAALAR